MRVALLLAVLVLGACGGKEPTPVATTPPPAEPAPAVAMPAAPPLSDGAELRLKAIDLQGNPVAGMVPIVTRNPNATDYPIATGNPSGTDGASTLTVPVSEHVCVRMWDPTFAYFANNYYDVEVGKSVPEQVLEITMVPGASLRATLVNADQQPAVTENVGIMMFHPAKGPWWPAEDDTDAQGVVRFPHLPAGKYTIRLKTFRSGGVELPDVALPPGAAVDLGTVVLSES